jgi:hypothetical protein
MVSVSVCYVYICNHISFCFHSDQSLLTCNEHHKILQQHANNNQCNNIDSQNETNNETGAPVVKMKIAQVVRVVLGALDAMQIWYQHKILCSNHQTLLQRCHLHPMTILQIIDFVERVGEWLYRIALSKLTALVEVVMIALRAIHVTVVCLVRNAI